MEIEVQHGAGVSQSPWWMDGWSGEEGLLCPAPVGFTQHLEGGASPAAFSVPALATWPGEQESGMKEAMDMPLRVERSMPCRS